MIEISPWGGFWWLMAVFGLAHLFYVGRVNPDILRHRSGFKKGTETWDVIWLLVFFPVFLSIMVVAGFDLRSNWQLLPQSVRPLGTVLFILGGGLFLRAMGENPFFEKSVRIQSDRDHHVIDSGPYRIVRHPGYVGLVVWILSLPLVLTSARALLPAGLTVLCLLVRTALEDRTLQRKLPGYAEYAAKVRWRLLPGVW